MLQTLQSYLTADQGGAIPALANAFGVAVLGLVLASCMILRGQRPLQDETRHARARAVNNLYHRG